jgi:hypothetical protein
MNRLFFVFAMLSATPALADCGDKGGPGYRAANGRCVGWSDIGKTCGNPPTTKCSPEKTSAAADVAAEHSLKAWEAGNAAREAVRKK